ncbi:MAG: thioredoxin [Pirellulales bacterium]|nr:thioredoxin [Pirellulales bacterium]
MSSSNVVARVLRCLFMPLLVTAITGCQEEKSPLDPMTAHPGKFVELTDANFDDIVMKSDKLVMIDFWNRSCQPCIEMAPWVAELSNEYEGRVLVGKLNTRQNKDKAGEHRAASVPQILFFKDGKPVTFLDREGSEVDRLGYESKARMAEVLDELLARETADDLAPKPSGGDAKDVDSNDDVTGEDTGGNDLSARAAL